jgi:uncharacterized membrane protein YgcG
VWLAMARHAGPRHVGLRSSLAGALVPAAMCRRWPVWTLVVVVLGARSLPSAHPCAVPNTWPQTLIPISAAHADQEGRLRPGRPLAGLERSYQVRLPPPACLPACPPARPPAFCLLPPRALPLRPLSTCVDAARFPELPAAAGTRTSARDLRTLRAGRARLPSPPWRRTRLPCCTAPRCCPRPPLAVKQKPPTPPALCHPRSKIQLLRDQDAEVVRKAEEEERRRARAKKKPRGKKSQGGHGGEGSEEEGEEGGGGGCGLGRQSAPAALLLAVLGLWWGRAATAAACSWRQRCTPLGLGAGREGCLKADCLLPALLCRRRRRRRAGRLRVQAEGAAGDAAVAAAGQA